MIGLVTGYWFLEDASSKLKVQSSKLKVICWSLDAGD
jgi:hypothetical protein